MLVVGLTGGIASGKSSVSRLLAARQIPLIDADIIAREVVAPGTPGLTQIIREFGGDVLQPNGTLDRLKLGQIIFSDEVKRKKLNAIIHPAVRKEMFWRVVRCWMKGEKVCVVDVPLLIEAGLWKFVGKVVVVYCSREIQLQRLMGRDKFSREDALSRINAQMSLAEKLDFADQVVDNSGSMHDLEQQVNALIARFDKEAGWSWRLSWLVPPVGLMFGGFKLAWRHIKRARRRSRRRGRTQDGGDTRGG
ncbi:hypothetical protein FRC05_010159 [Tulasnella sp. 425]|nr:hypothetical protein FRC05_010159 [Tulasnella sp. 425]